MKYKKLILLLSFILIIFIYIVQPYIESDGKIIDGFKKDIIRFHIRANSDRKEDQDLKYKVRDQILDHMEDKFDTNNTIEESRQLIVDNLDEMKAISQKVIDREGKDYDIAVSLGQDNFPIRKYGNLILPQGQYETLLIEIGEGKGQNWWCVMFPPLCLVDVTHSTSIVKDEENESLNEFIIDDSQPIKVKSIIGEKIGNIFE